jgi:hypothetical protein
MIRIFANAYRVETNPRTKEWTTSLMLKLAAFALGITGIVNFSQTYIAHRLHASVETAKDAQQDARMDAADKRQDDLQKERDARRQETMFLRTRDEAQEKETSDRQLRDEGIGIGLFTAITILQALNFLKKDPAAVIQVHKP